MNATPDAADAQRNASNADFVEDVTTANTKLQVSENLRQSRCEQKTEKAARGLPMAQSPQKQLTIDGHLRLKTRQGAPR